MRKIGKKGEAGFESEFRKLARIRSPAAWHSHVGYYRSNESSE